MRPFLRCLRSSTRSVLGARRDMALRTISLCSGGGGLDLGLDAGARRAGLGGSRAVCMVEGEAFAVATLAAQMEQGGLAPAPIWSDLRTFDARPWRGVVDCVTGGYPCQPFSLAGHRRGEDDPRHLWPDVARVLRECEPAWCFFENVSGHLSLGGHDVIRELQALGFRVACSLWTAEEVGAPHRRERLFVMGVRHAASDPDRIGLRQPSGHRATGAAITGHDGSPGRVADAEPERHESGVIVLHKESIGTIARNHRESGNVEHGAWATEPDVGRVAHGVAARVERLRMLGNGVVPEQAAQAFIELYNALTQG